MVDTKQGPSPAYIAGLVRVRAAAGVIFVDDQDRVLLVRPTYKDTWEVPGGAVEIDESPLATCEREVQEELGFTPRVGGLLCVDWVPPNPPWDGGLMFLFDGGSLTSAQIDSIRLPPNELDHWAFIPANDLDRVLIPRLARRVSACLQARERGGVYLEDGTTPGF